MGGRIKEFSYKGGGGSKGLATVIGRSDGRLKYEGIHGDSTISKSVTSRVACRYAAATIPPKVWRGEVMRDRSSTAESDIGRSM